MKKKNVLKIAACIAMLPLASCLKNDVEPVSGKNSVLQMEGIKFNNLITNANTNIKGFSTFDFYIAGDSTGNITDTVSFTDSFYVSDPNGYTQTYDFDTPDKTKKMKFDVHFNIFGADATASGMKIAQVQYKKNTTTHIDQPMSFTTTDNKRFDTTPIIVNF